MKASTPRPAVTHLNYPSHVTVDPNRPLGPNLLNELLWPVEVTYDQPRPGMARVGLSFIAPTTRQEWTP